MIHELLHHENIHLDVHGPIERVLHRLMEKLPQAEQLLSHTAPLLDSPGCLVLMPSATIMMPHFRIAGLAQPCLSIGISPKGVLYQRNIVNVILVLFSPEEDTAGHLKLLQRLSALMPELAEPLTQARSADHVLRILMEGEKHSSQPTFVNLTQDQIAVELRTDLSTGLTDGEAKRRLELHGPNLIRRQRRTPWYLKLLSNFFSFFAILLWLAALLCYLPQVEMPQLGEAILIVIFLNGCFAFFQEYRSDKATEALQQLISQQCRVIRNAKATEIDAANIVPGDLLLLEAGDIVPADARLIEANALEVDNASLTGESESAKRYKSDRPILIPGRFLWIELTNVVFAGSVIITGTGKAVVFGTGMNSEIGQIARMTEAVVSEPSPLQKQLKGTVYAIALLAACLGMTFLLLGWLVVGFGFLQSMVFFIGIFVANVPEGLLPTVTLSLAMGVSRMAKRNALIKNLSSVETLGCTTVICSDKTGTLTQNRVMVTHFWADGQVYQVTGEGYCPSGEFRLSDRKIALDRLTDNRAVSNLLECAHVCNNAHLDLFRGEVRVVGDPTEGALVVLARKAGLRGTHQRLHTNPFESIRKRMSVLVKLGESQQKILYVKGALVETLALCDRIVFQGRVEPLCEARRQEIVGASDTFAKRGFRIMAFAYRDNASLEGLQEFGVAAAENHLIFTGFTAMSDPVRPRVPDAIRTCHRAGIRVIMITGDYPLTAESVAREVGLGTFGDVPLKIYTGADLSEITDDALKASLAQGEAVFARVSPEQKLRIVSQLKALGEVVAVTGDGVNDGPAIRRADIGIAMGRRGTDVAKEAAHMILSDDDFSSIVAAVEEGRGVFENIKRFVAYILNSNPQELYPYIFWMLFPGTPLAMTVMGVLAVDVGTDLIPAMGLGIERPESGIMDRPPRKKEEKLLSMGFILRSYFVQGSLLAVACYATYYFSGWLMGWWSPADSLSAMPASPPGLNMDLATKAYLISVSAYFFPTVTTQIANVLCKRSWKTSIFSRDFLPEHHRREIIERIRMWRPVPFSRPLAPDSATKAHQRPDMRNPLGMCPAWLARPLRWSTACLYRLVQWIGVPLLQPLTQLTSRFLDRHPVILNFISNPLIDFGIFFELALCALFFYTGLSRIYYFAPLPWPVYLFAFHGTLLLFVFEEIKKYYRRKGYPLVFLG